jgi:hypothetical protein
MTELWNNWYETLVSIEALATVIVGAGVLKGDAGDSRQRYGIFEESFPATISH